MKQHVQDNRGSFGFGFFCVCVCLFLIQLWEQSRDASTRKPTVVVSGLRENIYFSSSFISSTIRMGMFSNNST